MKRDWIVTAVIALALALVLSLGVMGCLVTAFSLNVESPGRVAAWCVGACLFGAVAFSMKHGWLPEMVGWGALMGYHWHLGEFAEEFRQLVYRISHIYNQAYHWGVVQMVDTPWDAGRADLPLTALGMLFGTAVTWTVCRGKGASLPVCMAMVPLLLCVVVTDTVPEPVWLFLLILGMTLLILTGSLRREDARQGNRLTLLAALPVVLALGGLFLAMPREGYVGHAQSIRENLAAWVQSLSPEQTGVIEMPMSQEKPVVPETLSLTSLGPRRDSREEVLAVTAETGGTLYLRGQDYDVYDGGLWRVSPNRVEEFGGEGESLGYVAVETRQELNRVYLPYYPRGGLSLIDGKYPNLRMEKSYAFVRQGLPEAQGREAGTAPDSRYLHLPEAVREAARELLSPILEGTETRGEMAAAIGAYVRQAAVYDKNVSPMPEGAGDFTLWFLQEGKRGYCVHFATAAAVLLRAAGIESRYVSGYMLPVEAGETAFATGENAHAWVEYYEPAVGAWVILEATPAEGLTAEPSEPQPQASSVPTEETQETEPIQEITQPATEESLTPPETEAPREPEMKKTLPAWVGQSLRLLGILVLIPGLLEGQYRLRRAWSRWSRKRGDPNRQGLHRWRRTEKLAALLHQTPPGELRNLALKAKFSQHTLTEEELACFDDWAAQAEGALREKPWYWHLVYRYVFAAI